MNQILYFSFTIFLVLFLAIDVNSDESSDLVIEKQKYSEAKKALADVISKMKSDYIRNFASILAKGTDDLEQNTQKELKTEKDGTKRKAIIDFATKAYERLIKFINEIEANLPHHL